MTGIKKKKKKARDPVKRAARQEKRQVCCRISAGMPLTCWDVVMQANRKL